MKRDKIIYWIFTGILSVMVFSGGIAYIAKHEEVGKLFLTLGYPVHLVYLLAVAKILAVTAILSKKSKLLKSWAYAGLMFDLILATTAHIMAGDGEFWGALMGVFFWAGSFIYDQKLFK